MRMQIGPIETEVEVGGVPGGSPHQCQSIDLVIIMR
jgi:hypothetical protein